MTRDMRNADIGFFTNPSGFDPRHVLPGLGIDPDHFADGHVFGHHHGDPIGQRRRLVAVGGGGTLDHRRGLHDFQIDGLGQFDAQGVTIPQQCRDAFQAIHEPLNLILQGLCGKRVLLIILTVHEGEHLLVPIQKTHPAFVHHHLVQHVVALVGLIQLLPRDQRGIPNLVQGVGATRRGRVHVDLFHLVWLIVDVDDMTFLKVAGFGHVGSPNVCCSDGLR
ncbi:hypothetical protein DESC_750019 [Desulfosarcina cetonica]|nr:hypothetical protein DESC_750019 [Desulfosarcina cetonica]